MKLKKIMALALSATLAVGMLAGCCGGSSSSGGVNTPTVDLGNVGDSALTEEVGKLAGESITKEGVITYAGSQTATDRLAELVEGLSDEQKEALIAGMDGSNGYKVQPQMAQEFLKDGESLLSGETGKYYLYNGSKAYSYVDLLVLPADVAVEQAAQYVTNYLEGIDYYGKSLSELPEKNWFTSGMDARYNVSVSTDPIETEAGNAAYLVMIAIEVTNTKAQ